jgi:hypothetical protein
LLLHHFYRVEFSKRPADFGLTLWERLTRLQWLLKVPGE